MLTAKKHPNEKDRLEALRSLELLDTVNEKEFDDITYLASQICNTPIAVFSLVDENRQWFKSNHGLAVNQTSRDISFCSHTILVEDIFSVPNAKNDVRFADNPLVMYDPKIQFYAGIAICDPDSQLPIGTLCVMDNKPNQLNDTQIKSLRVLKNQLQKLIQLREQLKASHEYEKQLTVQNQRFEYILEGAGLGSWDWFLDTNQVMFDRRWCEMLGLRHEETPNELSTWDSLVHPEDKAKAYADIKAYLEGKTEVYENLHRLRHTSGDWVWIFDRGRISEWHENGKPKRFTGTHFDVTNQVKSEKSLEEAQKIAKIGSWSFDLRTKNQMWSSEHYKIFEIQQPQSQEKLYELYRERIHPDDIAELDRLIERATKLGEGFVYNHRVWLDNGTRIKYVQGIGQVSLDLHGVPLVVAGTCQDITDKVIIENELELKRAETIQASKMATLGEMAAGVAHEINNPLAIIKGNVLLFKNQVLEKEKFAKRIDIVNSCVDRIAKIVKGLSQFSRSSELGKHEPRQLSKIIEDAVFLSEVSTKRHDIELRVQDSRTFQISCNEVEIEQVLVNLIKNSVDAIKNLEQKWISITSGCENGAIFLRVMDSGKGIAPDIEEKIFQPFFTTKVVGEGTGLGLSISKGILENHNASIQINRNFKNTCFEIKFPLHLTKDAAA